MSDLPIDPGTGQPVERRKDDVVLEHKKKQLGGRVDKLEVKFTKYFIFNSAFLLVFALLIGFLFNDSDNQAGDIQNERFNGYVRSCKGQNERNKNTIREIKLSNTDEESKQFRIKLVNSLQPFNADCQKYARERVGKE